MESCTNCGAGAAKEENLSKKFLKKTNRDTADLKGRQNGPNITKKKENTRG